jgi:LysR family transcriptional regulator, low CO2-responsive transcriptional regulator
LGAVSITLTQLRSFLAVVRGGSVSAADELIVTQPSVSAAVRALSREVGADLLEREGRGVRPTPAGTAFAPFAADIIGLVDEGGRAAREAAAKVERELRIGAVTTAAESFVPPLMQAFAEAHPDIELTLSVGNRASVLEMLANHSADVCFGGRAPEDAHIAAFPFLPNEIVLISAPDDPLADGRPLAPAQLADRTWLLREEESGTRTVNEEFLSIHGLKVQALTVGSNGAIKRAARAGLGISFISRDAVAVELEAGLLGVIPVKHGPPPRKWQVMRSSVGPVRPIVEEFIAFAIAPPTMESLQAQQARAAVAA